MQCIICKSDNTKEIYKESELNFIKCYNCGVLFKQQMPTVDELTKIYNDFYVQSDDDLISIAMETNQSVLNGYANYINNTNNTNNILDVGCGTGVLLNELKRLNNKLILEGLEFDVNARNIAKQTFNIYENLDTITTKYDLISMIEVIEHLTDPNNFIKKIYENLNDNGTFIVTTPNINSLKSLLHKEKYSEINKPFHLVLFSEKSLKILLENAGFKNIKFIKYTPFATKNILDNFKMKLLQTFNLYGGLFVIAKK